MRKERRSRRSQKKQRGSGVLDFLFGKKEQEQEQEAPTVAPTQQQKNATLPPPMGATTKIVSGGMAPINMKEPMFYPTQRQLEWATTAGLPTKGGSRRRKRSTRSKKSKRKSRR